MQKIPVAALRLCILFLNTKPQLGGGISCIFTEVLQREDEMKPAQALHLPCFLFSSKIRLH